MKIALVILFLMVEGWLMTACGVLNATPVTTPTPDPMAQGRKVFEQVCAACHGQNAEGYANELAAPALDHSEHA